MNKLSLVIAVSLVLAFGSVAQALTVDTASTADNYYTTYVDGGIVINVPSTNSSAVWGNAETVNLSLASGVTHVIATKAQNYGPYAGYNPAAFIAELKTGAGSYFVETGTSLMVTDSSWLIYFGDGAPADQGLLKWYDVGYDDSGWASAFEIGSNGVSPWGNISGIDSSAKWIWTENWDDDNADTPVYIRKSFTPVPEPMTMLAVFSGLAGLGGYIRKRL